MLTEIKEEEKRREGKERNLVIKGLPKADDDEVANVGKVLQSLAVGKIEIQKCKRIHNKDLLIVTLADVADKIKVLKASIKLKGTEFSNVYKTRT